MAAHGMTRSSLDPLDHPIVFETPRWLDARSVWLEHVPFAMLLVDLSRPRVFVELGTGAGDSYGACCQAVDPHGLETRCYGGGGRTVDGRTGPDGPEVPDGFRAHHDRLYGAFSRLIEGSP